jgi:hypothetical protein
MPTLNKQNERRREKLKTTITVNNKQPSLAELSTSTALTLAGIVIYCRIPTTGWYQAQEEGNNNRASQECAQAGVFTVGSPRTGS